MKMPFSNFFEKIGSLLEKFAAVEVLTKSITQVNDPSNEKFSAPLFDTLLFQRHRAVYARTLANFVTKMKETKRASRIDEQERALTAFFDRCELWERAMFMLNVAMPKKEDDQQSILEDMFNAPDDTVRRQKLRQAVGDNEPFQFWLEREVREHLPQAYETIIRTWGSFRNFFTATIPQAVRNAWAALDQTMDTRVVPAIEPAFMRGITMMNRVQAHFEDDH